MEISEALKRFRQEQKLSQRQLSERINVPYQSYQTYEYGSSIPSAKVIVKIAQAFNVTTDYLLGLSDEPRPKPAQKSSLSDHEVIEIIDRLQRGFSFVGSELEKIREQLTH